jgi:thioredoxin 1
MSREVSPERPEPQPTRDEVDRMTGPVLLEFGAEWCGHCRALEPQLAKLLEDHPDIRHFKIEDGPGLRLGRSFRVKLWPTLVFMRDGQVLGQASRPQARQVREGLLAIDPPGASEGAQSRSE